MKPSPAVRAKKGKPKRQTARPATRIQARQKSSTATARLADPAALAQARRIARNITRRYPMRTWAKWTHHQLHGWWSHVINGNFSQIRFTQRDLDDLGLCWQRCLDESRLDAEMNSALDNVREKQAALDVALDALRQLARRQARALFAEQAGTKV